MQYVEDLVYGSIALVVLAMLLSFPVGLVKAAWLVLRRTKEEDEREMMARPPFERMQLQMFGTEREQAAESLREVGKGVLRLLAVVAWILVMSQVVRFVFWLMQQAVSHVGRG